MPAIFEVETGLGSATANSYVTVAEADQYFLDHAPPAAWTAAVQATKEQALRIASQYLDTMYNARWLGFRTNRTQNLCWPRSAVVDLEGFGYDTRTIPQRVKDACCEAARRQISGTVLLPDQVNPGTITSTDVQVGPLKKSVTYGGAGYSQIPAFKQIRGLLRLLLKSANIAERA